ncbi:MAG TPA: 3-dehydroquinate synthase [Gemmatimonadaceae bacterium]|nr:3-dehydroquinate synthase [Gemmatimonadaceae bacterium]
MSSLQRLAVPGPPVHVSRGQFTRLGAAIAAVAPAFRFAIITDSTVGPLWAEHLAPSLPNPSSATVFTVSAGESHKTRDSWTTLTDQLSSTGHGRDTTVVALGGGMIGDLAGFVAATYMRGINLVHVPTTLLAMVDAAHGGKTGVDTAGGKNLVGAFHPPAAVFIDTEVLTTLPLREFQAGLAEILKHGVVEDAQYFADVVEELPGLLSQSEASGDRLSRHIVRSIEIKTGIVARDEREDGLRKILNFGHTLGHGIEAASGYSLLHGEAVAIGMCAEALAAERAGIAEAGTAEAIRGAVCRAGLPTALPLDVSVERVMQLARADKKKRSGGLEYALPERIGRMAGYDKGWTVRLPDDLVQEVLQ